MDDRTAVADEVALQAVAGRRLEELREQVHLARRHRLDSGLVPGVLVALERGEDDEREDDGESGADDPEDVARDRGLVVPVRSLLTPPSDEDQGERADLGANDDDRNRDPHRIPLRRRGPRSPSLRGERSAADVRLGTGHRGSRATPRQGSAASGSVAESRAAALVAAERPLQPSVVGRGQPALAAGTVEHRALARCLADHGDPQGLAAASARPPRAGVDPRRLAPPLAARGGLDRVSPARVEEGMRAADERGNGRLVQVRRRSPGFTRSRKSASAAYRVPTPARLRWSSRAAPIVTGLACSRRVASSGSQSVPRTSGPRWPTRRVSSDVSTTCRSPSLRPTAVHAAAPTTARICGLASAREVRRSVASTRHCPSIRRCEWMVTPLARRWRMFLPRLTTSRVVTPRKSSVESSGQRRSVVVSGSPASAWFSRAAVRKTVSPSGTGPAQRCDVSHRRSRRPRGVVRNPARDRASATGCPLPRTWLPSVRSTVSRPSAPSRTARARASAARCRASVDSVHVSSDLPPRST